MRYRRQALRYLEAPEQLDQVVRLASPRRWLVGLALLAIVVAAGGWAVLGTVVQTVRIPGVLIHSQGISRLDATKTGDIVTLWTAPDARVAVGSPLYTLRADDGTLTTVTSPWDAFVVSIVVAPGNYVRSGTPIATFETMTGPSEQLVAAVFVPETYSAIVDVGKRVTLDVVEAPAATFGHLSGTVRSVSAFPETTGSLRQFLGDSVDTTSFLDRGPVTRVIVALDVARDDPGTLRWSKATPPFRLGSESSVNALFIISNERPISWLVGS